MAVSFNTSDLQEKLDYEKFIISQAIKIYSLEHPISAPNGLIIDDHFSECSPTFRIQIVEHLGGDLAQKIIENMSPLIFSSSYKMLDMIMEWIIISNQGASPWRFSQKIQALSNNLTSFSLPEPFASDRIIYEYLFYLYDHLALFRNKLIHGKWGQNSEGNLDFSFTLDRADSHYPAGTVNLAIPFNSVINLSYLLNLCCDMILNGENEPHKIHTIKYFLDRISSLHLHRPFGVVKPQYYNVVYKTFLKENGDVEINLELIRKAIELQHHNYIFSLIVHGRDISKISSIDPVKAMIRKENDFILKEWLIPEDRIPASKNFILDNGWDDCLI